MATQGSLNKELVEYMRSLTLNPVFIRVMPQHLEQLKEYLRKAEQGEKPFENKESYFEFCAANIAVSKVKHMVWNDNSGNTNEAEDCRDLTMPPLKTFHYTEDEKEMHKTLDFKDIKVGDVVHLKVLDEDKDKFKLQILNKYGDHKRIADSMLYADLIKDNPLVKQIYPPLKKSDLLRAVVFGNVKLEVGVYTNRLVSLNPKFVKDPELSDLNLGRVFKRDIPFYPQDISTYRSFGAYLENNNIFENPKQIQQKTRALNCDPLKTGPFYDVRCQKHLSDPVDNLKPAFDETSVIKKTTEAEELLHRVALKDAFEKINEALSLHKANSWAWTVYGKISLVMSEVLSNMNMKQRAKILKQKAYTCFIEALKIDCLNIEAANFHDFILKDIIRLNPTKENEIKSRILRPNYLDRDVEEFMIKFKGGNIQPDVPGSHVTVKEEVIEI